MFILEVTTLQPDDPHNAFSIPAQKRDATPSSTPQSQPPPRQSPDAFTPQDQDRQLDVFQTIEENRRRNMARLGLSSDSTLGGTPPPPYGGGDETEPFGTNNGARLVQAIGTGAFLLEQRLGKLEQLKPLTTTKTIPATGGCAPTQPSLFKRALGKLKFWGKPIAQATPTATTPPPQPPKIDMIKGLTECSKRQEAEKLIVEAENIVANARDKVKTAQAAAKNLQYSKRVLPTHMLGDIPQQLAAAEKQVEICAQELTKAVTDASKLTEQGIKLRTLASETTAGESVATKVAQTASDKVTSTATSAAKTTVTEAATAAKASRLTTWFGKGATLLKFVGRAFAVLGAAVAVWDLINDWTDVFKAEEGKVRKLLMAVTNTACTGIGAVIGGFIGVVGGPPGIALGACAGAGLGNLVGNLFKSGIHQDGMINNFFERLFTRV